MAKKVFARRDLNVNPSMTAPLRERMIDLLFIKQSGTVVRILTAAKSFSLHKDIRSKPPLTVESYVTH